MAKHDGLTILHVLSSSRLSGAENVAIGLIREGGGVYCSPDGDIRESLKEYNIEYIGLKKMSLSTIKPVVQNLKPDIIYAHDFRASLLIGYYFGKKYDVVSYIHQNPDWLDRTNFKTFLYKKVMNNFKKIIIVSDSIGERKLFKGPIKKKVVVQYNKVDKNRLNILAREKVGQKYDFCFVGRFCDVKQPGHFVSLMSKIKGSSPNLRAVMLGDGELMESVKKMIRDLKLEKNIDVIGFQKNPYKYISASKVLVVTSKNEGLPMAVLEAVSLGSCVLSYNYPTLCAVFSNKKGVITGVCENIDDMQQKATLLISNTGLYKKTLKYQSAAVGSLYGSRGLKLYE